MKGQVSIEYLVMFGLILAAVSIASVYAWRESQTTAITSQAEIAVDRIVITADNVYAQGPGAKTTVNIFFPNGYRKNESYLSGKNVLIRVYTPIGALDFLGVTKGNITGSLPNTSGYKLLTFELKNDTVNVTSS